ncbi:MAG: glycosyltransferase family 9 protein [Acidobacteriia bacterium]|nr:glycosyltransferase family 9 protein [Terriglobia bacterium]
MIAHYDCRHFLGHKPCIYRRPCEDCPHYAPFGKRILIIKLAAVGDVLRTTPLLRGLRRAYPDSHITWLTESDAVPLLQGVGEIDRLVPYSFESVLQIGRETFDQLYCLDKEPKAIAMAMGVQASDRIGFGMSRYGNVKPLSPNSEYMFELGIDDLLKFRLNSKTYPELLFECAGLPYPKPQEYLLPDLVAEIAAGRELLRTLGIAPGGLKVGLNTGASDLFATKKWTEEGYAELADLLARQLGATALLLGGPAEAERNARIAAAAAHAPVNAGTHHSLRSFAGIIGNLDLIVTGDTLAMHIAIGLGVPALVILGATCHKEIELYGRGAMIVSDFECSPCYLSACPKKTTCMRAIPAQRVFGAAARLLRR